MASFGVTFNILIQFGCNNSETIYNNLQGIIDLSSSPLEKMIKNNVKQVSKGHTHHSEAKDFKMIYDQACAISGTYPLKSIKTFLDDGILDISGDRISAKDWPSVFKALCRKHSLRFIAVRSFWQKKNLAKTYSNSKSTNKPPSIHMPIIINELVTSLAVTISITQHLTCLELQNVPLHLPEIQILSKSLSQNHVLQHLSLYQCLIRDEGLEVISKSLKNCFNITSINFSCCGLTWKGAQILVNLIKHQTIHRHSEAWRETLRNAVVNLDVMGGLQRVTINGNPRIGDKGAHILADILQDPWLKAIDIQNCGIQESGARALLNVLKFNTSLYILDIRKNSIRDHDLLLRISQQLYFNNQGQTSQFKWLNNSTQSKKSVPHGERHFRKKSIGIPWRIAERFNSTRHYHSRIPGIANIFYQSSPSLLKDFAEEKSDTVSNCSKKTSGIKSMKRDILTTVEKELQQLRNKIFDERTMRKKAELRIMELTAENEKLKQSLSKMSLTSIDDDTLDAIEATFMKFNAFIKMLQSAGYTRMASCGTVMQSDNSQMQLLSSAKNQRMSSFETSRRCRYIHDSERTKDVIEGCVPSYLTSVPQENHHYSSEKPSMNSKINSLSHELHATVKNNYCKIETALCNEAVSAKQENYSGHFHYAKASTANSNSNSEKKSQASKNHLEVCDSASSFVEEPHTENVNGTQLKSNSSNDSVVQSSNISTPDTLSGILNSTDKF